MGKNTKQLIIDCTVELAGRKPINRITIHDIVSRCGITRNAFYYHFHDIYDVLDQAISDKLSILETATSEDYDAKLFEVLEFATRYKAVWRNLYKAIGRDDLQKYVMNKLHIVIEGYIVSQAASNPISATDVFFICTFYEEALFGILTRWVRGEIKEDSPAEIRKALQRIQVLFQGSLALLINNSSQHPES